jgi:hypothetical protein
VSVGRAWANLVACSTVSYLCQDSVAFVFGFGPGQRKNRLKRDGKSGRIGKAKGRPALAGWYRDALD